MNLFRAVQKRLTLELREMGTRDRVMGDCMYLGPMEMYNQNGTSNLGNEQGRLASSQGDKSSTNGDTNRSALGGMGGQADKSAFQESMYSNLYKIDGGSSSPLAKAKQGG